MPQHLSHKPLANNSLRVHIAYINNYNRLANFVQSVVV